MLPFKYFFTGYQYSIFHLNQTVHQKKNLGKLIKYLHILSSVAVFGTHINICINTIQAGQRFEKSYGVIQTQESDTEESEEPDETVESSEEDGETGAIPPEVDLPDTLYEDTEENLEGEKSFVKESRAMFIHSKARFSRPVL